MKISILTATYNRAKFLDRLYKSIVLNNNCKCCDIEWLIMDDGSTDNTKQVVEKYIRDKIIDIKYYFQENQGKMKAINKLIKYSTGDIIIECDSDDYFTEDAFNSIQQELNKCDNMENIYAFVFLKYDQKGKNMGNNFPKDNHKSNMFDLYFKEGITGEKALVYNSAIRKKYEYEIENNEKFVTEARMHHQMDLKYNVKCFNKTIMICEYQKEGYSKNINKLFLENPYGYYKYFKEIFDQNMNKVSLKKRLYIYKHYILFSVLSNQKDLIKNVKGILNKICVIILYIPGKIVTKIKMKNHN